MLKERQAMATVAVRDLETARSFYEEILGLAPVEEEGGEAVTYKSGGTNLLVYESEYAGTNEATAVTWDVGPEMEGIVGDLKEKGVSFEHYDLPGMERQGDLHVSNGLKAAWFKDPDGNILALVGG